MLLRKTQVFALPQKGFTYTGDTDAFNKLLVELLMQTQLDGNLIAIFNN